jgi:ribose transport system substrate-binding protein
MKRPITLALAGVMLATAATACGGSSSSSSSSSVAADSSVAAGSTTAADTGAASSTAAATTAAATSSSGKKYNITLIQGVAGDTFYGSMACGAKDAGAKLGASIDVQGATTFAPATQIPVLNAVVAKHPDAILIAPTDPNALAAPLKQAAAAGIKIVLVDTTLTDPSLAVSEVTSDNIAAGSEALKVLAKQVGEKGSVFVLSTTPGVTTTDDRAKGFVSAIKGFPNMTSAGIQYDTQDSADRAAAITNSELAAHADLAGVFALNTFTGQGAATALKQAGKLGKVKLVGFDATASGVQALNDGTAQAQVVLKPLDIGYQGVEQAINALQGKPTEKKILTGAIIATKDNVATPEVEKYLYKSECTAS